MLFKAGETPPPTTEDRGLSLKRQANPVNLLIFSRYTLHRHILRKDSKLFYPLCQAWIEVAGQINCPASLPEEQEFPLLTKMLFSAPYNVLEKKPRKAAKGTRSGLRRKGASDVMSEDETHSLSAEDDDKEEEEEEDDSPPEAVRKKRVASKNLEAKVPKRGKGSPMDNFAWDVDSSLERPSRAKSRAKS